MKTVPLSVKSYTPELVLQITQDNIEKIEDVIVVVRLKDGTLDSITSHMSLSTLCLFKAVIDRRIRNSLES